MLVPNKNKKQKFQGWMWTDGGFQGHTIYPMPPRAPMFPHILGPFVYLIFLHMGLCCSRQECFFDHIGLKQHSTTQNSATRHKTVQHSTKQCKMGQTEGPCVLAQDICEFTWDPMLLVNEGRVIIAHNGAWTKLMNGDGVDYVGQPMMRFFQEMDHQNAVHYPVVQETNVVNSQGDPIRVRLSVKAWQDNYAVILQDMRPVIRANESTRVAACLQTQQIARKTVDHVIKNGVYGTIGVLEEIVSEDGDGGDMSKHKGALNLVLKRLQETSELCSDFEKTMGMFSDNYLVSLVSCELVKSLRQYIGGSTHNENLLVVDGLFPARIMLDWKLLRLVLDNVMTNARQNDKSFETFTCRLSSTRLSDSENGRRTLVKIEISNKETQTHSDLELSTIRAVMKNLGGGCTFRTTPDKTAIFKMSFSADIISLKIPLRSEITSHGESSTGPHSAPYGSVDVMCGPLVIPHSTGSIEATEATFTTRDFDTKTFPPPRMFYADDETLFRMLAKNLIRECGGSQDSVISGESPEEVTKIFPDIMGANPPMDIVILDQHLGKGGDGTDVLGTDIIKKLRNQNYGGVVFVRSGNDSESDKKFYMKSGANAVLGKNQKPKQIKEIVRLLWEQKCLYGGSHDLED
jgi:CheY-like chemotaxis protein